MATRFDRVTHTPSRPRPRAVDLGAAPELPAALSARLDVRILPVRPLAAAMATWLLLALVVCHVAAPLAAALVGLGPSAASAFVAIPAFVTASFVTLIGALVARPPVQLGAATRADAVLAAVAGSLSAWAVVQLGFAGVAGTPWLLQAGIAAAEAALLGVMFGTLARRPAAAFAIGAGFKLLWLGLALTLLRLL